MIYSDKGRRHFFFKAIGSVLLMHEFGVNYTIQPTCKFFPANILRQIYFSEKITFHIHPLDEFQEKVWILDFCQLLEIWNNLTFLQNTWLHFNVLLCLSKQIQTGAHGPQIRLFSRVSMYLYLMNARLAEVGLDNSPKTKKDALQRRSTDPLMCIVQCSCSNSWLLPAWLTSATQLSKFGQILQLRGGQYPCFICIVVSMAILCLTNW